MTARRVPAAEWQAAKGRQTAAERAKMAAWLGIPADDRATFYAMLPFARLDVEGEPMLAAILAPPLPLASEPRLPGEDADVLLITGRGEASLHRDTNSALVGTLADGALYTDGLAFVRDWARQRFGFIGKMENARDTHFMTIYEDPDGGVPGTLGIGDVAKIRHWPIGVRFQTPNTATAEIVNISIWRAARLSRAAAAPSQIRAQA